jgi:hypothetical protein
MVVPVLAGVAVLVMFGVHPPRGHTTSSAASREGVEARSGGGDEANGTN